MHNNTEQAALLIPALLVLVAGAAPAILATASLRHPKMFSGLFARVAAALLMVLLLLAPTADAMVAPEVVRQTQVSGQTIGANNIMPTSGGVLQGGSAPGNTPPRRNRRRNQPQAAATVQNTPVKTP